MKRSCLRVNFKRKVKYHSLLLLFFVKDEQHGQCEIPLLTVGASIFCGGRGGGVKEEVQWWQLNQQAMIAIANKMRCNVFTNFFKASITRAARSLRDRNGSISR